QASRGEALPDEVRQEMEAQIGFDFADVHIHRDTPAQRASELLHANAFAFGQQVYFGAGSYVPESQGGRRLLAHELAHVVQQRQGRVAGLIQRDLASFVKKFKKTYGQKVLDWAKTKPAATTAEKKKAKEFQDKMARLKGRLVKSKKEPELPE